MIDAPPLTVPLTTDRHGVVRVAGTRIPLETVIVKYRAGYSPEQIVEAFDTLDLADVYAVLSYYLRHRKDVDDYLGMVERNARRTRDEMEARFPPEGVRERLLKRRDAGL